MDDVVTTEFLFEACTRLAQATLPSEISAALMSARLTALTKPEGGVRGLATGLHPEAVGGKNTCQAIHEGNSSRSVHLSNSRCPHVLAPIVSGMLFGPQPTATDHRLTILSVDGIGAYDHVLRAAMLTRLSKMPEARKSLPFVRLSYAGVSSYTWFDEKGERHVVNQAEGGEQGDPLLPLLFSIGIQGALEHLAGQLQDGERVFAFLDDVYILCQPHRLHTLHSLLEAALWSVAGIRLHQGKTRAWNIGSIVPEDIEDISPEAWQPAGIKVLGTPIGSDQFVADKKSERIAKERERESTLSRLFRTSSVRGSFSYRAQIPEQTTPCARCRPQFPGLIVRLTTKASGARQRL